MSAGDHLGAVQSFYAVGGANTLPHVARAEGPYLWDTNGKRYIDAASGPVVTNIGHGNRHVVEAIAKQSEACAFASRMAFASEANEAFAVALSELCGPGYDRVFPTSGGSEAVEASLKFARQLACSRGEASRWKIISRDPSYHGSTLGALSVTGDVEAEEMFGPMMVRMPKVPAPFTYRVPDGHTAESWAEAAAGALEETILREGPDTCLAFIMEPVGGLATGALVAPDRYHETVREICSRHGLLLIYDEIMSGAGRTGHFLAADHWPEARPDIVALAKGLGAGYTPLGAMVTSAAHVDTVAKAGGFLHGHTYVANPLSCATGLAVLEEVERQDLIGNVRRMSLELAASLRRAEQGSPIVGDVRGKGFLRALELVLDKEHKTPFAPHAEITQRLVRAAMSNGLIVYARRTSRGKFGEWIMIGPPLDATDDVISEIEGALNKALADCLDGLVRDGLFTKTNRPHPTAA